MGKDKKKRTVHSKTRYKKEYEEEFSWVMADGTDVYSAFCKLCHKSINISLMGKAALKSHESRNKTHVDKAKVQSSMHNFVIDRKSDSSCTKTPTNTGKFEICAIFFLMTQHHVGCFNFCRSESNTVNIPT